VDADVPLGVVTHQLDQLLLRVEARRQLLTTIAEDQVAAASAVDVDVLHPLDCQQVAERPQRTVHHIEALPDLPELDLGELGEPRIVSRGVVVPAHGRVREAPDGAVVRGQRLGQTALAEKVVERVPPVGHLRWPRAAHPRRDLRTSWLGF